MFHIHKWKLVFSAGVSDYYECIKCGKRKYKKRCAGYSPADRDWLSCRWREH